MNSRRQVILLISSFWLYLLGCKDNNEVWEGPRKLTISLDTIEPGVTILPLYRLAVLRDERGISVTSMLCTHQTCLLKTAVNSGALFECPCHGSRFSVDGTPINGPATEPLPRYRAEFSGKGLLTVYLDELVSAKWRLPYQPSV